MLKKIFKFLSIFLIYTLALTFQPLSPVSALEIGDIVVQVEPAEQQIDLTPGETFTGTLRVQNIGRLPFNFTLSARPYQILNDNYDPDFTTENDYTKLYNWLSFPQVDFHLEPDETTEVKFNATVPVDAPGGGQYAAIIVETRDSADPKSSVRTVTQVASLIYAHVDGDIRLGGDLTKNSLPSFLLGQPFSISATVKNTGNLDFRYSHSITITDFFTGNEVFTPDSVNDEGIRVGWANPIVLPDTSRTNTLTWEGAPQLGVFRVKQTVDLLGDSFIDEGIVFLCPIWLVVGIIFLLLLMIVWLILRVRKRKHSRPQVM